MRGPEKTGPGAVAHHPPPLLTIDKQRRRVTRSTMELRKDRAERRPAPLTLQILRVIARLALIGIVLTGRADDGAEEGKSVGEPGESGKQLADLDPRHGRSDRRKLTTHLRRPIGLHVDRVHLRRPAVEMNMNHRPPHGGRSGIGPEQIDKPQPTKAGQARREQATARRPRARRGAAAR